MPGDPLLPTSAAPQPTFASSSTMPQPDLEPLDELAANKVLLPSDDNLIDPVAPSGLAGSTVDPVDNWTAPVGLLDDRMFTSDPPCLMCATPNPPQRRFCRKCGQTLSAFRIETATDDAGDVAIPPWWRRLFDSQARLRYDNPVSPKVRALRGAALGGAALLCLAIMPSWGHGFRENARSRVRELFTSERVLHLEPDWVTEPPGRSADEVSFGAGHVRDGSLELAWRSAASPDQLPQTCDKVSDQPGVVITFPEPQSIATITVLASPDGPGEDKFCFVVSNDNDKPVVSKALPAGAEFKNQLSKVTHIAIVPVQPKDPSVKPSIPELKITTR